jgi:hypothetical protein
MDSESQLTKSTASYKIYLIAKKKEDYRISVKKYQSNIIFTFLFYNINETWSKWVSAYHRSDQNQTKSCKHHQIWVTRHTQKRYYVF